MNFLKLQEKEIAAFTCKRDIQEAIHTPSPRTACRGTLDLHSSISERWFGSETALRRWSYLWKMKHNLHPGGDNSWFQVNLFSQQEGIIVTRQTGNLPSPPKGLNRSIGGANICRGGGYNLSSEPQGRWDGGKLALATLALAAIPGT